MSTTEDTLLASEGAEPAGEKPAEQAPAKVDVKYELKVPPGLEVDQERIVAFAKQQGLSQEQAQALVDRDLETRKSFENGQLASYDKKLAEWAESARGDKEYGGEKFSESVALARGVLDRFGSESLRAELNGTGLGNHPELIRLLWKVGKAFDDDKFVFGQPKQQEKKKSYAEALYGTKE